MHMENLNFHPDQDQQDQHVHHLDPALQQSNEISTAPGGFNAFPINFVRTDLPDDDIKDDSPGALMDSGSVHSQHGGNGGLNSLRVSGRTSIMLGENGEPIPDDQKPPPGTDEYVKMRKVNHKEVERKRRQTINEGLDELAKLIASPHSQPEKNKGAVLQKAVSYIIQLKRDANANIEKYTMDKLLSDQEANDMRNQYDHLYQQFQLAKQRAELWKAAASGDEEARNQVTQLESHQS